MDNPFFKPTPDHLRELVLDYLCHQSYTDTARAFAQESTSRKVDEDKSEEVLPEKILKLVQLRREIKRSIMSGRVEEATQLLNEHFPAVLDETSEDPPPPHSSNSRIHFISQTSVKPIHLSLNLRILSFIESTRTIPLEYPPNKSRPPSRFRYLDDPDLTTKHQDELLHRAQKLYAEVASLANQKDRETYLKELTHVGGLLAYREPEKSPLIKYLSQERRSAVADQVNSAILYRTGRPAISHLELYARYTSALWSFMHDLHVPLPPAASRPPGVSLPPNTPITAPSKASGPAEKESSEVVPLFNLQQLLNLR
ncbi:hypothetical protein BD410DRAFT_840496 [Rickenella mellea]|uniref:CTLH domain-containing protein n=1 Tax=Rickenella mellea TaxID=50990 RepID=A0A4Y7Q1N9_9AGAM|nr:hypothetical protein BD410DRAFT_840496 [Rickenella mellea]